jgi:hypothetical protein
MKIFKDALRSVQNFLEKPSSRVDISDFAQAHPRYSEFLEKYKNGDKTAIKNFFILVRVDYYIAYEYLIPDAELDFSIKFEEAALWN